MPRRLKPSMREHKRYIAYEIVSKERIMRDMHAIVAGHLTRTLGIFDGATAGIVPVSYDQERQRGIFRVQAAMATKAKAALLIAGQDLYGTGTFCRILAVSGNLSGVKHHIEKTSG